jgi:F-type H+-transporting ATPase subunit delta
VTTAASGATGLAARYAAALFDLAEEKGQLDRVAGDLARLGTMVEGSADLVRLIRSPRLSREDQHRGIDAVMREARLDALTRNFVALAARNRRLAQLPEMIAAFRLKLAERAGEVAVEVASAKPLNSSQTHALEAQLKKALGAKVAIHARVEPALLSGLVVKVGSRMVDHSLRSRLARLRSAMKGTA